MKMWGDDEKEVRTVVGLRWAVRFVAFALVCFATGCSRPQDVTNDPSYGNFKVAVGTWKSKVPLILCELDKRLYLVGTNTFMQRARQLSAVPVGTEIGIRKL